MIVFTPVRNTSFQRILCRWLWVVRLHCRRPSGNKVLKQWNFEWLTNWGLSSRNKLSRSCRGIQRGFFAACFRRRARKLAECHLPAVASQIYLMCELHRKWWYRVIRIGFHRGITEQSDVEARTHLRYSLHWLQEPTNRNPSYTLSSERGIR